MKSKQFGIKLLKLVLLIQIYLFFMSKKFDVTFDILSINLYLQTIY